MRDVSTSRPFLSALLVHRGRHTFRGLIRSGARPRPVLAIIASL
jgi:hypothetical protein